MGQMMSYMFRWCNQIPYYQPKYSALIEDCIKYDTDTAIDYRDIDKISSLLFAKFTLAFHKDPNISCVQAWSNAVEMIEYDVGMYSYMHVINGVQGINEVKVTNDTESEQSFAIVQLNPFLILTSFNVKGRHSVHTNIFNSNEFLLLHNLNAKTTIAVVTTSPYMRTALKCIMLNSFVHRNQLKHSILFTNDLGHFIWNCDQCYYTQTAQHADEYCHVQIEM